MITPEEIKNYLDGKIVYERLNPTKDEIDAYMALMEKAAGDKSEHGKRQPAEKCMYEIQREESNK